MRGSNYRCEFLIILCSCAVLAAGLALVGCGADGGDVQGPEGVAAVRAVPASNPVPIACWDFDEGSGTTFDDGCDGHGGEIYGASWVDGVCGAALAYDGVDDYVAVPEGDWLTQPKGTVCGWIRIDPDGGQARIISAETSGYQNGLHLGWVTQLSNNDYINGGIAAGIHSSEGGDHYAEVWVDDVARGPWHFVAFVWDGDANSLLLYVDGITETTISAHPGVMDTEERFTIGAWEVGSSHGAWFKGAVDEVKFYDQALTVDQLNDLYAESCAPLAVALDVRPGSCRNPLNWRSQGVLPVAILGAAEVDAGDIDVSTVALEGVAPVRNSIEDVSGPQATSDECACPTNGPDGYSDLTLKFCTQDVVAALGSLAPGQEVVLTISGRLMDGTAFEGADCVVVVGPPVGGKAPIRHVRSSS